MPGHPVGEEPFPNTVAVGIVTVLGRMSSSHNVGRFQQIASHSRHWKEEDAPTSRNVVGQPMGGPFEGQREMVGRDMGTGPLVAMTH